MSLKIQCCRCNARLVEFGGLVFTPPDDIGKCSKLHVCRMCCADLVEWLAVSKRPSPSTSEASNANVSR